MQSFLKIQFYLLVVLILVSLGCGRTLNGVYEDKDELKKGIKSQVCFSYSANDLNVNLDSAKPNRKSEIYYDRKGRVLRSIGYGYRNDTLSFVEFGHVHKYACDGKGNEVLHLLTKYDGRQEKTVTTYKNNKKIREEIYYGKDDDYSKYSPEVITLKYDKKGEIISYLRYHSNGNLQREEYLKNGEIVIDSYNIYSGKLYEKHVGKKDKKGRLLESKTYDVKTRRNAKGELVRDSLVLIRSAKILHDKRVMTIDTKSFDKRDGTFKYNSKRIGKFNKKGLKTESIYYNKGHIENQGSWVYNKKGKITRFNASTYNEDGSIKSTSGNIQEYDKKGNVIKNLYYENNKLISLSKCINEYY